ncbi:MAG: hypothetical protein Cons2KO_26240 [Congregibacter sp.]
MRPKGKTVVPPRFDRSEDRGCDVCLVSVTGGMRGRRLFITGAGDATADGFASASANTSRGAAACNHRFAGAAEW